jgi:hypothetical protein
VELSVLHAPLVHPPLGNSNSNHHPSLK